MKFIPQGVTRSVGRTVLQTKANSPHIFFALGIAGVVTSGVLACRATLKLRETLDAIEADVDASEELKDPKDKAYVYVRAGLQLGKLYGPSIIVGAVSIAALSGSHIQLTRRNTALMAAYATLQKAFEEYRTRVEEQLGSEKEQELYLGAKDEGKGKTKSVVPGNWSPYARFFDEACAEWKRDPELNRLYIQCQQNYLTQLLLTRGHVFLNEAYDALGLDRTREGSVVGWVYPSETGDNYISFGMHRLQNANFLDGTEPNILLDFNVDGVIYNLI
jgi:hypothetical protein